MTIDVQTSKTSYSRGQTVTITVPVSDSGNGAPIKGATVKVIITDPNNKAVWTGSSTTNSNGLSTLNYRLSNSATRGTYSITATVTFSGYSTSIDKTSFAVK
jgi:minor extracellular protease Epr